MVVLSWSEYVLKKIRMMIEWVSAYAAVLKEKNGIVEADVPEAFVHVASGREVVFGDLLD